MFFICLPQNSLVIDTPRVRKQTRPFSATKDELAELSEGESDGDETKPKFRRNNERLNSYGRTECFRVEKNLLVYGWDDWDGLKVFKLETELDLRWNTNMPVYFQFQSFRTSSYHLKSWNNHDSAWNYWFIRLLIPIRWGRWKDILAHGRFKKQLTEWDVESICRALLSYCLVHYRGDDKIKSFMWDLIAPTEDGRTKELQNHLGKCHILQVLLHWNLG